MSEEERMEKGQISDDKTNQTDNEEPKVYALKRKGSGWYLSRREFITGMAAATAGLVVSSCGGGEDKNKPTQNIISPNTTDEPSNKVCNVRSHTSSINTLAITPDDGLLISASKDSTKNFGLYLKVVLLKIWRD